MVAQQHTAHSDIQKQLLGFANRNRKRIVLGFKILYGLIGMYYLYAVYLFVTHARAAADLYTVGIQFAQAALLLLLVIILPGILGRLGIRITFTFIFTNYRRYLGILMFLLAFTHYSFLKLIPSLIGDIPFVFPYALFEMFGWTAFVIFFCMFLTANEYSYVTLGKWWKRLHRLIYVALWLLVLHIGLQFEYGFWTYITLFMAVLETISLVVAFIRGKQKRTSPNSSTLS